MIFHLLHQHLFPTAYESLTQLSVPVHQRHLKKSVLIKINFLLYESFFD